MTEHELVEQLRAGDEDAFTKLVATHHNTLVRVARAFVGGTGAAEEVAQETWVAVLKGIATFEERSTLKTWIYRILCNLAQTRAKKQGREVSFEATEEEHPDEGRFSIGFWKAPPKPWLAATVEAEIDNKRVIEIVRRELETLAPAQRAVVIMRDIEGLDAKEVCNVLGIEETNQRVLLHRARARLRSLIEKELGQ